MKLLVDIGNTRIKWAFSTGTRLLGTGEARHADDQPLREILAAGERPREIRLANVSGGASGDRIAGMLAAHFGIVPLRARSAAAGAGVRNGYRDPRQLGVDRWLAVCAAFARFGSDLVVLDAGTATTVDGVTRSGEHRGGFIVPGIELMQKALLAGTGDLGRLAAAGPGPAEDGPGLAWGRDTASAIRQGALQATAALARTSATGLVSGGGSSAAEPPVLVLTGGAAPMLKPVLEASSLPEAGRPAAFRLEHRPWLVLEGLALDPPCCELADGNTAEA